MATKKTEDAPAKSTKKAEKQEKIATFLSCRLCACYAFVVDAEDMPTALNSQVSANFLAMRYLRDKIDECSFTIVRQTHVYDSFSTAREVNKEELFPYVNQDQKEGWWAAPRVIMKDPDDQSLRKQFQAECVQFNRPLPTGGPLYMMVAVPFYFRYDFPSSTGKAATGSIQVYEDWKAYNPGPVAWPASYSEFCWRYAMQYGKQVVTATSIYSRLKGTTFEENFGIHVSFGTMPKCLDPFTSPARFTLWGNSPDCYLHNIYPAKEMIGDAMLGVEQCTISTLPFFDKLLSLKK